MLCLQVTAQDAQPILYLGDGAELSIRETAAVTVAGDFRGDFGSQFLHDGQLSVTGAAELLGTITITLRGATDFSEMDVDGEVYLQDGILTVLLAEEYSPTETTVHSWLTSGTNVDGPFDEENLPGFPWRTEFDAERHAVIYDAGLPVEWLYFHGEPDDKRAKLTWATASEQNASHYLVQRLEQSGNWLTAGRVNARGNDGGSMEYLHYDPKPATEDVLHYRLRQVDLDGTTTLSSIVTVTFPSATSVTLWPNPAVREIELRGIGNASQAELPFSIIDAAGRTLQRGSLSMSAERSGRLLLDDSLLPGAYFLRLGQDKGVIALPFVVR